MTAITWAKQLIDALPASVKAGLRADPHSALRKHFKLKLHPMAAPPERGHRGWCDGLSILEGRTVFYLPTRGRRENFTLLHELGHFLTAESPAFMNWVADIADPYAMIEEVCDRIAALLLLPIAFVDHVLDGPVSAAGLLRLFRESAASRQACAIAITERLGCQGFVAIIERASGQVSSASRVPDTLPTAWRHDSLPGSHPLWEIEPRKPIRRRSSWPHSDGVPSEYWLDAVADEHYIYAIFAAADLWGIDRFHGTDVIEGRASVYEGTVHCRCGFQGTTRRYPCPDCQKPYCPGCGKCECVRRAEDSRTCPGCHLSLHRSQMKRGACADCIRRGKVKF